MDKIKELLKHKDAKVVIALIVGLGLGIFLYPTSIVETEIKKEVSEVYERQIEEIKESNKEKISKAELRIKTVVEEKRELLSESKSKLDVLKKENKKLKESSKKKKFKLVKPDGTIIEKEYEETNREEVTEIVTEIRKEFDFKIRQTESRWKNIHFERVKSIEERHKKKITGIKREYEYKISVLEKKKKITTNPKKLRLEAGITTDQEYHLHGSYNLFGPFGVGIGTQFKQDKLDDISIGIGVSL